MARTLTKAGRKPNDEPLPDQGCEYAPACQACPWRECVWLMSKGERHVFRLAYRTLATFRAPPDADEVMPT